jgi:hypothetical protein
MGLAGEVILIVLAAIGVGLSIYNTFRNPKPK